MCERGPSLPRDRKERRLPSSWENHRARDRANRGRPRDDDLASAEGRLRAEAPGYDFPEEPPDDELEPLDEGVLGVLVLAELLEDDESLLDDPESLLLELLAEVPDDELSLFGFDDE